MRRSDSLGVISHLDPAVADLVALSLVVDGVDVFACALQGLGGGDEATHGSSVTEPTVRFTQYTLDDEGLMAQGPLNDECITCGLRHAIVNFAYTRMMTAEARGSAGHAGRDACETVIILPQGVELPHLMPNLTADLADVGIRVMGTLHLINVASAREDLLSHVPLADRGAQVMAGDDRCVAEVHQLNMGYADAILAIGHDPGGARELIEHLRPHDVLLFDSLDNPIIDEIRRIDHVPDESIQRVHPATTQAWGGPCDFGTWTLDLYSDKPFHPQRLREFVGRLCAEGVYARGCFWLPTRPNSICSWEGIGEVLSVGSAGQWSDFDSPGGQGLAPHCHLILTGVGSGDVAADIERAFALVLFGDDEDLLAWAGRDDGFDDWFA